MYSDESGGGGTKGERSPWLNKICPPFPKIENEKAHHFNLYTKIKLI
jgi:hypothetical protein